MLDIITNICLIILFLSSVGVLTLFVLFAIFQEINRTNFVRSLDDHDKALLKDYTSLPFWKIK